MSAPTSPSTESSTVAVLKRIEARLADPSRWCQTLFAINKNGEQVSLYGKNVVACCLEGARMIECESVSYSIGDQVRDLITNECQSFYDAATPEQRRDIVNPAVFVNDVLGHAAVMAVVRRAIELAEQGGTP